MRDNGNTINETDFFNKSQESKDKIFLKKPQFQCIKINFHLLLSFRSLWIKEIA